MGVYANGQLIYGFINTDDTEDLFEAIKGEEESFSELREELCQKHNVTLASIGFAPVDIVYAFSVDANSKNFDCQPVKAEDLAKTEEYKRRIQAFLADLEITTSHEPGWHILGYMD